MIIHIITMLIMVVALPPVPCFTTIWRRSLEQGQSRDKQKIVLVSEEQLMNRVMHPP